MKCWCKHEHPSEVCCEAWAQLNDCDRRRLEEHLTAVWYDRIGQYWTDAQWVAMLTAKGTS